MNTTLNRTPDTPSLIIEALRGLGALMVLVHHYTYHLSPEWASWLAPLHVLHWGVDLFFVLTGYLFAPLLLGLRSQPLSVFVRRRAWRLYPLYGLSLALAVLMTTAPTDQWLPAVLRHVLFLQAAPDQTLPDLQFFSEVYWTLTVEAAFYLLVAFALLLPWGHPQWRFYGLGALSLVCFVVFYTVGYAPLSGDWVLRQAQLPALLLAFWLGCAVYWWREVMPFRKPLPAVLVLAGGLVLLSVLVVVYPAVSAGSLSPRPFGWFNQLAALGFALLLVGLLGLKPFVLCGGGAFSRLLVNLGAWSYGIYLFHGFIIVLLPPMHSAALRVLLASLVTVLLAALLHHYVEQPCRQRGRLNKTRPTDRRSTTDY